MSDFRQQMPDFNIDPKKVGKYVAMGVLGLILVVMFLMSWQSVEPGEQGFCLPSIWRRYRFC